MRRLWDTGLDGLSFRTQVGIGSGFWDTAGKVSGVYEFEVVVEQFDSL